jgi:hypothetical protein
MLTVNAVINKLLEVVGPYLMKKLKKQVLAKHDKSEISRVEKEAYTLDKYDVSL